MDVSECESMELQHFSHPHPLVFKYQTVASEEVDPEAALCLGCEKPVEGWSYGCNPCEFYLHKECAELELAPQIQHPFHSKHPLTLLPKSPYSGGRGICDFCVKASRGFFYHCYACKFDLDINCALLQSSIAANFPNSLHPHPLFFIQNHNNEVDSDCSGCQKPISGPFYHCSDCRYPRVFNLHKECAELPLEINHPCDRKHPLTLFPQPPTHPQKCSCYLCRIQWEGFVYSCSLCNFDLSLDDFFSPPIITVASHEHPWMLVSRKMSFVCDFCGTVGEQSPYHCATCQLLVHKNCISLPRHIMISRHPHTISLSYSFRQNQVEDRMCRVCHLEVDTSYGCYRCSAPDCNYIAHALCATAKAIWDGTVMLESYDERSEEVVHEPWNLITDVVEQISSGELMVASKIKHFYHDHNLRLTFSGKTKDDDSQCYGCMRPISTPFYSCEQCKFFLDKDCAELPKQMPHPFHKHLLTLSNSHDDKGFSLCNACGRWYQGFSYKCYKGDCSFEIDIHCMLFSDTLEHPSHEHSLFLVHNNKGTRCSACFRRLIGDVAYRCMERCDFILDVGCATLPLTAWNKYDRHPLTLTYYDNSDSSQPYCNLCEKEREPNRWFYYCVDCDTSLHLDCALCDLSYMKFGDKFKYYHHKECAELELAPQIQHPFHPKHPLTLLPESPYFGVASWCNLCGKKFRGFVYNCYDCKFDLHINCALLQSSIAANFTSSLHPHPLFFIQNHNNEVDSDCSGCQKPISGPFYHCSDCTYHRVFNLHKECAELLLEINHPCDRMHLLTLLPQPPTHTQKCSCYLCRIQWKGFVYSCSLCNFDLSLDDFRFSPPTITVASHEHPWMLVSRKMWFVCDFCGTDGDHSPYYCDTCVLFVHKNCISLPRHIRITRHRHTISLWYSFQQNQIEDWMCKICYKEVDISYGHYRCPASRCRYIAHVRCATDKEIWDGRIMPKGYDEGSGEVLDEPNLITDVFEQIRIGELVVASEIKHSYHDHKLRLTFSGKTKDDDSQCDGCTRPISTPFYGCEQCKFFLHKDCAELPKQMPHPFHRHLLTLSNTHSEDGYSRCSACDRWYQGFQYRCYKRDCRFEIDIQCMLLSNTFKHPRHDEHSLFLDHKNQGRSCSACFRTLNLGDIAYRCMKRCDFSLDVGCATLPLTGLYKYDRHPLKLTYSDDPEPSQHYCDLCEKEREPNRWFYCCVDCDNSLHLNCAIGDLPYMKLGNKIKGFHKHPLTIVKNIWNCPPCKVCREVCDGQALECKESECNFTVHWNCRISSESLE
ncbi:uncharacterized protein LOC108476186 [Gossypium arboreum]|uniref:uncharacterized protein LOC108476186 n=1 Tax=Gossypium arboreum TaxID=29729 RepID=UPI0008196BD8|nr:uncharacterized protein LOC108476186 [Gossypium arboreum]